MGREEGDCVLRLYEASIHFFLLQCPVCQSLPTQPIISFVVEYFLRQDGYLGSLFGGCLLGLRFFFPSSIFLLLGFSWV